MSQLKDLTWDDLNAWAGSKIVSRGRRYQQQGRVSELAHTADGALVAWVDGSDRYATRVDTDTDGMPASICTCPYECDCKHGVAVVLEYLERVEHNRRVPPAGKDDERLELLADEDRGGGIGENEIAASSKAGQEIDAFLKGKTKAQLIGLVHEIAEQYPEIAQDLTDRKQIISGDTHTLVKRLRREIRDIGAKPGWRNHWDGEGYTPDYSGIRKKLEVLLKEGHANEVLILGQELVATGTRQVEESDDEGETAGEIAGCMPVIVEALDQSSLECAEKLTWALDAVLRDDFDVCEAFLEYLQRRHPPSSWRALTDRLLVRLHDPKSTENTDEFSRNYARDRLSDWAIHAMERAGRQDEIIPLCEVEATRTHSYGRLVERLVAAGRYEDAERWIQKGFLATKEKWPGIAAGLRSQLREIRALEQNRPAVAAMEAEDFVRRPSRQAFTKCKGASSKLKAWPTVREYLLGYLEKGDLPWEQEGWPLPETSLDAPGPGPGDRFPMVGDLIGIAILEKKPDEVLRWYDRLSEQRFGWRGVDEDEIATAVQTHAPDRAVAIWRKKAEWLIAQVKPSAYQEAATYLRKAGAVMALRKEKEQWDKYLRDLRETHARKRRLMEILDGLEGKAIASKRG
ncbi:MAG: SWIM zinc finger family protein [Thermoleophilia bacterium]